MILLILFMVFESTRFPRSVFYEGSHNHALFLHDPLRIEASVHTHYGVSGVNTYMLTVSGGSLLLNGMSFGYTLYRENTVHGGYAFNVLPRVNVGMSMSLLNYWVKDHVSRYGYALNLSVCFKQASLVVGGWAHNINIPHFNDIDVVPLVYAIHTNYEIQKNLTFYGAVRGENTSLPFLAIGLAGAPHPSLTLGIGATTEPLLFEYMVTLYLGMIDIEYLGTMHEFLGMSHAVKVVFRS